MSRRRIDAPAAPDPLLRHRRRLVAPLCAGRIVADADAGEPVETADIVLSLAPLDAAAAAARIAALAPRMAAAAMLAIAVEQQGDEAVPAAALTHFPYVATYCQRGVTGSLIMPEPLARARMTRLADPSEAAPVIRVLLCARSPLPDLACGLFETGTAEAAPAQVAPHDEPAPRPGGRPADPRIDAVGLVERLVARDEEMFTLRAELSTLRSRPVIATTAGGFFDPPRTRQPWKLAEQPDAGPDALGHYDHRPDDAAVLEGRAGAAFLASLDGAEAADDFAAAVQALNAGPHHLPEAAEPAASIIIPLYGQLAYALNCLHSLFHHVARHSAEIIVIDDVSPDCSGAVLPGVTHIRYHRRARNGGFIASCNEAAGLARGRVLILLNSDTRVVEGWLDALLGSFTHFPRAGFVGSKLLYPDGSQQEAGGILWRDGSAWNYGRNDDPNRPQYCHARQVDYCSGAAVAVPRAVWTQMDGFDTHYAPAYCEDADLCMRLRAAGHETWYQPAARVVHYEGRTMGTDTAQGLKAYQVINNNKMFLRFRHSFATHRPNGEAPFLERERSVRLRALVVDATTPTPKQDAGSVTTTQTLRLFRELGYKAHFVPQDNMLFQPAHTAPLQAEGVDCAYAPYDASFDEYLARYGWQFDVVLVYRVTVLEKVLDVLRRHASRAPVLFHPMDLHFLRMQREAALLDDAMERGAAAAAMEAKELALIARVDCTITHSTYERDLIAERVPGAPVVVWPFMFDLHGTDVGFAARRDFVFLGGYRHPPNVDAVQFFARDVLPLIRAAEPAARFVIAGANPTPEVLALAGEHVEVTGMIDDLRTVFDRTRVFACSLRVGAGTKGKVSTAMAYGLPVVSTACGAEGMELTDGREVLLADDPADFAAACLRVYRDPRLWSRMSRVGMKLVAEKHSLGMGREVLAGAIEIALAHRLGVS